MSTKKYDGGPAFPQGNQPGQEGLSIRDHFAGLAMQAIIAKHGVYDPNNPKTEATKMDLCGVTVAEIAFVYADDMLAERAEPPKESDGDQ